MVQGADEPPPRATKRRRRVHLESLQNGNAEAGPSRQRATDFAKQYETIQQPTMPDGGTNYTPGSRWFYSHLSAHAVSARRLQSGILPTDGLYETTTSIFCDSILPPGNTLWTGEEKSNFFASLSRHSRLRPDLIAEDLRTKTETQVSAYLSVLAQDARWERYEYEAEALRYRLDCGVREFEQRWLDVEDIISQAIQAEELKTMEEIRTSKLITDVEDWGSHVDSYKLETLDGLLLHRERRETELRQETVILPDDIDDEIDDPIARDDREIAYIESITKRDRSKLLMDRLRMLINRRRNRQHYRRRKLMESGMATEAIDALGGPDVAFIANKSQKVTEDRRGAPRKHHRSSYTIDRHLAALDAVGSGSFYEWYVAQGWDVFNLHRMGQAMDLYTEAGLVRTKDGHGMAEAGYAPTTSFATLDLLYRALIQYLGPLTESSVVIAEGQHKMEIDAVHVQQALALRAPVQARESLTTVLHGLRQYGSLASSAAVAATSEAPFSSREGTPLREIGGSESEHDHQLEANPLGSEEGTDDVDSLLFPPPRIRPGKAAPSKYPSTRRIVTYSDATCRPRIVEPAPITVENEEGVVVKVEPNYAPELSAYASYAPKQAPYDPYSLYERPRLNDKSSADSTTMPASLHSHDLNHDSEIVDREDRDLERLLEDADDWADIVAEQRTFLAVCKDESESAGMPTGDPEDVTYILHRFRQKRMKEEAGGKRKRRAADSASDRPSKRRMELEGDNEEAVNRYKGVNRDDLLSLMHARHAYQQLLKKTMRARYDRLRVALGTMPVPMRELELEARIRPVSKAKPRAFRHKRRADSPSGIAEQLSNVTHSEQSDVANAAPVMDVAEEPPGQTLRAFGSPNAISEVDELEPTQDAIPPDMDNSWEPDEVDELDPSQQPLTEDHLFNVSKSPARAVWAVANTPALPMAAATLIDGVVHTSAEVDELDSSHHVPANTSRSKHRSRQQRPNRQAASQSSPRQASRFLLSQQQSALPLLQEDTPRRHKPRTRPNKHTMTEDHDLNRNDQPYMDDEETQTVDPVSSPSRTPVAVRSGRFATPSPRSHHPTDMSFVPDSMDDLANADVGHVADSVDDDGWDDYKHDETYESTPRQQSLPPSTPPHTPQQSSSPIGAIASSD